MRAGLRVAGCQGGRGHARANTPDGALTAILRRIGRGAVVGRVRCGGRRNRRQGSGRGGEIARVVRVVNVALMLLQLGGRVEALCAVVESARVASCGGGRVLRPG